MFPFKHFLSIRKFFLEKIEGVFLSSGTACFPLTYNAVTTTGGFGEGARQALSGVVHVKLFPS